MTKFKFIIPMIMLLLVVGIVLFLFKSNSLKVSDQKTLKHVKLVEYFAKYTENLWFVGPSEDSILECKNLAKDAPIDYYRCNKKYLECALDKKINYNGRVYKGFLTPDLVVTYKSDKKRLKFQLDDNCHMAYLPQNLYSNGIKNSSESLWDNINRNFYIDKYYVSNANIYEWNPTLVKEPNYKANLSLSIKEKRKYCKSVGKSLLESHIFDAASFIYDRDSKNNYFYKHRANFKKGRSFLRQNKDLKLRDCYRAYVLGCEKLYAFKNFDSMSLTWTGINYALGAYPEVLINRFDSKLNLKSSSMFLDKFREDHRVGYRTSLKEEKGAFRCMLQL